MNREELTELIDNAMYANRRRYSTVAEERGAVVAAVWPVLSQVWAEGWSERARVMAYQEDFGKDPDPFPHNPYQRERP